MPAVYSTQNETTVLSFCSSSLNLLLSLYVKNEEGTLCAVSSTVFCSGGGVLLLDSRPSVLC